MEAHKQERNSRIELLFCVLGLVLIGQQEGEREKVVVSAAGDMVCFFHYFGCGICRARGKC